MIPRTPSLIADRIGMDSADLKGYLRKWARKDVEAAIRIRVLVRKGRKAKTFNQGTAVVRNISLAGALLVKIKLKKQVLPAEPFTLAIDFLEPRHKGIGAIARPVHFGAGRSLELGVEFVEFWVR